MKELTEPERAYLEFCCAPYESVVPNEVQESAWDFKTVLQNPHLNMFPRTSE